VNDGAGSWHFMVVFWFFGFLLEGDLSAIDSWSAGCEGAKNDNISDLLELD
jgi:hypothetical protein